MTTPFASSPSGNLSRDESARIRMTIASAPVFRNLSQAALEDLASRAQTRRFESGAVVMSENEVGNAMYLIMKGRIKVSIFGENGREVTLAFLRQGGCFGEVAMFGERQRTAHCVAVEATVLLAVSRDDLLRHVARFPGTAMCLLGQMAKRLRRADRAIAELALCDVNERLVNRLVELAVDEGEVTAGGMLVKRRPTQQELANMIGSCRETVSRTFNQLAKEGKIVTRGRSLVVSDELLRTSRHRQAA